MSHPQSIIMYAVYAVSIMLNLLQIVFFQLAELLCKFWIFLQAFCKNCFCQELTFPYPLKSRTYSFSIFKLQYISTTGIVNFRL